MRKPDPIKYFVNIKMPAIFNSMKKSRIGIYGFVAEFETYAISFVISKDTNGVYKVNIFCSDNSVYPDESWDSSRDNAIVFYNSAREVINIKAAKGGYAVNWKKEAS